MNLTNMTAPQLLKAAIIMKVIEWQQAKEVLFLDVTHENIDQAYDDVHELGLLDDAVYEIRQSGIDTGLPCPSSRHYECDAVAIQVGDKWVGFNYWYGGGKHGEPEAIDWIDDAYFVKATPKVITSYDFEKEE